MGPLLVVRGTARLDDRRVGQGTNAPTVEHKQGLDIIEAVTIAIAGPRPNPKRGNWSGAGTRQYVLPSQWLKRKGEHIAEVARGPSSATVARRSRDGCGGWCAEVSIAFASLCAVRRRQSIASSTRTDGNPNAGCTPAPSDAEVADICPLQRHALGPLP